MSRDPVLEIVMDDSHTHVLKMGPVQPKGIQFPQTSFGTKNQRFQPEWYTPTISMPG